MKKMLFGLPMMGISLTVVIVSTLLICAVDMPLVLTALLAVLDLAAALTFSLCPLATIEKEKREAAKVTALEEKEVRPAA